MATQHQLAPASELVKKNEVRFPNESSEYRLARDALLAAEIELRRHIERVAEQRPAAWRGLEPISSRIFFYRDVPAALDWLARALGFTEEMRQMTLNGMHAQMTLDGDRSMMG